MKTDKQQKEEVTLTKDNSSENGSETSLVNELGPNIPNDLVEEPLSQEIDR